MTLRAATLLWVVEGSEPSRRRPPLPGPDDGVEPRPYPRGGGQQSDGQDGDDCLADPAGGGTGAAVEDVVGVAVGSSIGDEHRAAERQTFATTQPRSAAASGSNTVSDTKYAASQPGNSGYGSQPPVANWATCTKVP